MQPYQVKTADVTSDSFRMLAIPFGGPLPGGKDTDGEFFSKNTDLGLALYDRIPLMYNHGSDSEIEITAIGYVDRATAKMEEDGWWVRIQLDASHKYHKHIQTLIERGVLYGSSSAIPWLVKKAKSGELLRWPWIEQSCTPTPANLFSVIKPDDYAKHFKSAGIDFAPIEAVIDEQTILALPDGDFAYVGDQRHLPLHDARAVKAALESFTDDLAPFTDVDRRKAARKIVLRAKRFGVDVALDSAVGQTAGRGNRVVKSGAPAGSYEERIEDLTAAVNVMFGSANPGLPTTGYAYLRATYPDYVIVTYKSYDESDGGADYRIEYTDDDGGIQLGEVTQMEQVWVPAKVSDAWQMAPIAAAYDMAHKFSQIALARTQDVAKRRLSEGRDGLSAGHLAHFNAQIALDRELITARENLLTAITPPAKASAERLRILDARTRLHALKKESIAP